MTDKVMFTTIRLGDVCDKIGSGATPRGGRDVYLSNGVSLIRSQNVYNDHFQQEGLAHISDEHADELANVTVQAGDVLLNITGDSVARCCHVPSNIFPARVNQHVAIIRPNPSKLNPRYLMYYLVSPSMQRHMLTLAGAGATRNALTKGMIEDFNVPSPPLSVQNAIAHILGTLDDKIELNRRMNETLEAMTRAIFKSWFVDFDPVRAKAEGRDTGLRPRLAELFPNRFQDSELGEIPAGWRVDSLGNLIELAYGKALKQEDRRLGGVAVYGSNGRVGWHDERLIAGPGIVVGRKGNPGVVTWVPMDFFPIDTTFYVVAKGECRSLQFLFYALRTQDLASLGADSAVPGLNRNLAYMSQQIVPSGSMLETFDALVQPLYQRIYEAENESRTLASIRDALLPKLLSGEIRIKDAERFVEGVA